MGIFREFQFRPRSILRRGRHSGGYRILNVRLFCVSDSEIKTPSIDALNAVIELTGADLGEPYDFRRSFRR